jgi:predicted NACHT family NTPase
MAITFEWKRFWCPRGDSINLSDRGFLYDPEDKYGKYINPNLVTFKELSAEPCLALLGEPGIGKSWTLRSDSPEVRASLRDGERFHYLDLRSFGEESRLVRHLFESDEIQSWRNSNDNLHVFLDSLDECLLRIDHVAALLAEEFRKVPVERLRLRIACRTFPWPMFLEEALATIFGSCGAYEMAPLRRKDVRIAAEQSKIADPDAFLRRIDDLDVSSLAIKPVTLKFLLSVYAHEGDFPKNHLDLYEKGCRVLAEESSGTLQAAGRRGRVTVDQRIAIASRVAAVTQLGNRFAVHTGPEADGVAPEDITLADLAGGMENPTDDVRVSEEALREVLNSGLFSARGPNRMGWAHQTYAEFLTARYVKQHEMPITQIRPLIFHPSNQGQKLVPQLHEVAAWMAATNSDVLGAVAASDPEALLGAAAASLSGEQREAVVDSLLRQASAGRTLHLQWGRYGSYHKLGHPRLAAQLRPYLATSQKVLGARLLAVSIARACRVEELGPELVEVALDPTVDKFLRHHTAATAAEIGTSEVRALLRPLAFGEAGDDPEDELKGSGLRALWPEFLTAGELFDLLTLPKQRNLSGTYSSFFYDRIIPSLKAGDLPVALQWFARQPERRHLIGPVDRLMDKIVECTWPHVEEPEVGKAFANALFSRLRTHDALFDGDGREGFYKRVQEEHARRRAVLNDLLPQLSLIDCGAMFASGRAFLSTEDCPWYVRRVLENSESPVGKVEARLARMTLVSGDMRAMNAVYEGSQKNEILKAECGSIFEPILLDSDLAKSLKEEHRLQQEWKTPKLLDPPPSELVKKNLENVEDGNVASWVELASNIRLEPTSTHYPFDPLLDLTQAPGWNAADSATQERIVKAAIRYAEAGDPQNEQWVETAGILGTAIAGFQALVLLSAKDEERLGQLAPETWVKWVPVLVRYPFGETHGTAFRERLLKQAYNQVPEEVIGRIFQAVNFENQRSGHLFQTREIESCWDERMEKALVGKLTDPQLKPNVFATILDLLWSHGVPAARGIAEAAIDKSFLTDDSRRSRMMSAAHILMKHAPDGGWALLWPLIQGDTDFGEELVESLSFPDGGNVKIIPKLTEAQLGELYVWLVEHYPYVEHRSSFGVMRPGETAAFFRDGVLENLKRRGTFAACDALRKILDKFPAYTWLAQQLEEAEWLARAATWQPVSIPQLLALASNRDKRIIETGADLMELVLESLQRLDATFRGDLPAGKFLWNESNRTFRPKDEEDFSDYVARHMREDLSERGIVVNREVQIRKGIGSISGQLTDILVDAVVRGAEPGRYEPISLVVELKGNWHRELITAMETQLRDRYLKDRHSREGIYLVGWFDPAKWDEADGRKEQVPEMSLADARIAFADQAENLSTDGYSIKSYVLDIRLA